MRTFSRLGAVGLVLFLSAFPAYSWERFQANATFNLGFPQDAFKDNVGRTSIGGTGFFTYRIPRSPLQIGLSLGGMIYGSEVREESLSVFIPDVFVDVKTRNYILLCHLLLRVQPQRGEWRPYIDGLVGFHYLWTETGVYDQQGFGKDDVASTVHLSDTTLSYGLGGGLMVRAYERRSGERRTPFGIYMDLGVRYLMGVMAEYMKEGSLVLDDGELVYDVYESKTNIITTHIGLTFVF